MEAEIRKVSFGSQEKTAKADLSGNWMVRLEPLSVSKEPLELVITGKNTINIRKQTISL